MEPFETKVVRGVTLRKDPSREPCFTVADTDDQMISWPDWSDQSKRERIHRHMNNEMTTTEVAAQCLLDDHDGRLVRQPVGFGQICSVRRSKRRQRHIVESINSIDGVADGR